MENKILKEEILQVIRKIKLHHPKEHKLADYIYFNSIYKELEHCEEESWRWAVNLFWEDELWEKPLVYFKAIVRNRQEDLDRAREKELRKMGDLPDNFFT